MSEELALLAQELSLLASELYQGLEPLVRGIQGGRSPKGLGMEEALPPLEELVGGLKEVSKELKEGLGGPIPQEIRQGLEGELRFWDQMIQLCEPLIKKLQLLSTQTQISSLGKMPVEDAWQDLEKIAGNL